jgi:hypothetical protein
MVRADGAVHCENGLVVRTKLPKGVGPSDTVLVCYDYTTNTITKIIKPISEDTEGEDHTCEVEIDNEIPIHDFWDSVAL